MPFGPVKVAPPNVVVAVCRGGEEGFVDRIHDRAPGALVVGPRGSIEMRNCRLFVEDLITVFLVGSTFTQAFRAAVNRGHKQAGCWT